MLTHIDSNGKPQMVNVTEKENTHRMAIAQSIVVLPKNVVQQIQANNIKTKKGPIFDTAIIAGTMAAKKCSELIPFCHSIPIEGCKIEIEFNSKNEVLIRCRVETYCKTGVEMEALTGASVAALTVYDMCKAISHDIKICSTELIEKSGGQRGYVRK